MAPAPQLADLTALATRLLTQGPRKTRLTPRRVRALFNHTFVADTTSALHVWEHDFYPQFYVPVADLKNCSWKDKGGALVATAADGAGPVPDESLRAAVVEITVPGPAGAQSKVTDRAIRFFAAEGKEAKSPLAGLIRLEFGAMDEWLEEDVPVIVHPKDPFKRVDLLASTRPIKVRVGGQVVASTNYAVHLHETSLITRYYIPLSSVDVSVLRDSELTTQCPYKGTASYNHVELPDGKKFENVVWYYKAPLLESIGVAGLVSFYNEKVEIELDGVVLEQPKSAVANY